MQQTTSGRCKIAIGLGRSRGCKALRNRSCKIHRLSSLAKRGRWFFDRAEDTREFSRDAAKNEMFTRRIVSRPRHSRSDVLTNDLEFAWNSAPSVKTRERVLRDLRLCLPHRRLPRASEIYRRRLRWKTEDPFYNYNVVVRSIGRAREKRKEKKEKEKKKCRSCQVLREINPFTAKGVYTRPHKSVHTNAVNKRLLRFSYCNTVTVLN